MSEIADLGARALHDVAIGVNQQIELAGEGREIMREIAFDFVGFAAPYRGDSFLQLPKRFQAIAKLRRRRDNEGQRENREGDHEVKLETGDLRFDFLGRRGNLIGGIDDAFARNRSVRLLVVEDDKDLNRQIAVADIATPGEDSSTGPGELGEPQFELALSGWYWQITRLRAEARNQKFAVAVRGKASASVRCRRRGRRRGRCRRRAERLCERAG